MLSRPYSILLVDDEEDICDLLSEMIYLHYKDEFKIISTTSPEKAASIIQNDVPHIFITDLNMPKSSGYDLAGKIRKKKLSSQVVYITGYNKLPVALTCFEEGATGIIFKPLIAENVSGVLDICKMRLDYWAMVFSKCGE